MGTFIIAALLAFSAQEKTPGPAPSGITPSAQIDAPASASKLVQIRRFMCLIGLQRELDTGSFLERYALPGAPLWPAAPTGTVSPPFGDAIGARIDALKAAYAKRRSAYQQAYESHLNWEFTEDELKQINAFLGTPVGQHYLDGRWRMEAYVSTDTESLDEEIVNEALATLNRK